MATRTAKSSKRAPKPKPTRSAPKTKVTRSAPKTKATRSPAAKATTAQAKRSAKPPKPKAKARLVKARPTRIGSTEERETAALLVAPSHDSPIADADLERLSTAPLDTLTTRRLAPESRSTGAVNENAPPPTLSSAPLATITPRGVFLPDRVVVDIEGDTFPSTRLDEHGRDEAILPAATLDQIRAKAADGLRLIEARDPGAAFATFRDALELLPQPHQNWNAAGWLLVAMGECAVRAGDWLRAILPLKDAMHCPGTIGNPWVHLRLGQVRLELADERAADELARAYMGGGRSLFEDLDPKYFALVEQVLQPPPGHDRLP